jgi:hypothetical protein
MMQVGIRKALPAPDPTHDAQRMATMEAEVLYIRGQVTRLRAGIQNAPILQNCVTCFHANIPPLLEPCASCMKQPGRKHWAPPNLQAMFGADYLAVVD